MQMMCLKAKLTTRKALPTGAEGDTSIRPLAFFSEIMTPSRFEQDAPLTPATSQKTSGAECLGKYLSAGGEGNKGPF